MALRHFQYERGVFAVDVVFPFENKLLRLYNENFKTLIYILFLPFKY